MRTFVSSVVVVLVAFTLATADEITGTIKEIKDGDKQIVVTKGGLFGGIGGKKKAEKAKAEDLTLELADNCKFVKGTFDLQAKGIKGTGEELEKDGKKGIEALRSLVTAAAESKDKAKDKGKAGGIGGILGGGGGVLAQVVTADDGDNKGKVTEVRVLDTASMFGGDFLKGLDLKNLDLKNLKDLLQKLKKKDG